MRNGRQHQYPLCAWCGRARSEHYLEPSDLKPLDDEAWLQAKAEMDAVFLEQHHESLGDGLSYDGD